MKPYFISLIFLFSVLTLSAQSSKSLSDLWGQIESMSFDNTDLELRCVEYINAAPLMDEHAFRCRLLLADYYMSKKDMMGIYLQYAFFKYYLKQNPNNEIAVEYKANTKALYFSLVKADMDNLLPAGRYFSPDWFVGFIIRDTPEGKTCEIEHSSHFFKHYKYKMDYTNGFLDKSPLVVDPDDEQWMEAEFTYTRVKNGNSVFAQSLIKNRNELLAEGHGTVSESDANLGQRVAGHAATDISAGLMTLLAKAASKSKAINHVANVAFYKTPYNLGYMATFYSLKKTMTSDSDQYRWEKTETILRLFKMYPHYMECFTDIIKVAGFNVDPIDFSPVYQILNPKKFFPQYFNNNKSYVRTIKTNNNANNNKMSKFLYDFVFSPWIKKCGAEQRMPPFEECSIQWTPYSIGFECRNNKKYGWFDVVITHKGKIEVSGTTDEYGCKYVLSDEEEQYNTLATDPYDN